MYVLKTVVGSREYFVGTNMFLVFNLQKSCRFQLFLPMHISSPTPLDIIVASTPYLRLLRGLHGPRFSNTIHYNILSGRLRSSILLVWLNQIIYFFSIFSTLFVFKLLQRFYKVGKRRNSESSFTFQRLPWADRLFSTRREHCRGTFW